MGNRRHLPGIGLSVLMLGTLGGCVNSPPRPLYYWGDYQNQVYAHFKAETGPEEQILKLEGEVERAASKNQALPPGFRAHLAFLYGKTGRLDKMAEGLEAEKQKFPESAGFVDFLLKKPRK